MSAATAEPRTAQSIYSAKTINKIQPVGMNFVEKSDRHDRYFYEITTVACNYRSKFQQILIADTVNFGRVLVLDGHIQSAYDDEKLYHEFLVQPAMLAHPNPEHVLIIGGGEGASLRETLVHRRVKKAVMVDIDGELLESCKRHLPTWHRGAFDDPRAEIVVGDGRQYVENCSEKFDVVIIDVVDMLDNGPAQKLYTKQFYAQLKKILRTGAIVAIQGMEFSTRQGSHFALVSTLKRNFSQVHSYKTVIPSFLASWGFVLASDCFDPSTWTASQIDGKAAQEIPNWLAHINGEFLKSAFVKSNLERYVFAQGSPIIEDGKNYTHSIVYEEKAPKCMKFPVI